MQTFDEFDRGALISRGLVWRRGGGCLVECLKMRRSCIRRNRGRSWLIAGTAALFAHLIESHQDERGERDSEQSDRGQAVQLIQTIGIEIAVEERQSHKDEEDMCAEDPQGSLTECWERLDCYDAERVLAEPEKENGKRKQIDDSQRTDLPFVEGNGECLG